MSILWEVQGYMEFFGWSDGGRPGAVKQVGEVTARHGDEIWRKDVQRAEGEIKLVLEAIERERERKNYSKGFWTGIASGFVIGALVTFLWFMH